jgi:glycosyltransferase involved in cell wall biosynthesis
VERYALEISKRIQPTPRMIAPNKALGQINGHLWEQFLLPFLLQKNEILWSPANTGAWIVRDQVVTIHDASVFDHPEWFNPIFSLWTRISWKILARRAKAIITVSNFSRERLKFHLEISEDKIHVIHNGVGESFKFQQQKSIETAREKYGLSKPYFLFVGTHEPRKNLTRLMQAWELLNLKSHSLFIAGAEGNVFSNNRGRETRPLQAYISDEHLPALYSGATAVIVPSFYEGFGLTILEAMACGAPVIVSDIAVFREIFNGAALFVDPHDPQEMANAMMKIVEDKSFAMTLREKGLSHASKFSWDESARKTQGIIKEASDSHL